MAPASTDERTDLARVRERRNALRLAMASLEEANAGPASPNWRPRVTAALDHAAAMLSTHVDETEGPEGFFAELVAHEPRVAQQVATLRDEHVELQRTIADLIQRCTAGTCTAAQMRGDVERLVALLHRHRHAGADLLYEAYEVDVAFGD